MLPNLKVQQEDIPKKLIVCGDPARAKQIASLLESAELIGQNREYHSYAGSWKGKHVGVVSHGVGAPGAAVCFEELAMADSDVMIRVGTAGSYQEEIKPGSLVISTAAVRRDGLSGQLVPEGFPAIADRYVTAALAEASNGLKAERVFEGITLTLDAFYEGSVSFPHDVYKRSNVLAAEMENAALFTIAALRGFRAGAILAIDGFADADLRAAYDPHTDTVKEAIEKEALIALNALLLL